MKNNIRNDKNAKRELFVNLSSSTDVIRLHQLSQNRKYRELRKPNGAIYFQISSLQEAQLVCQLFIEFFEIGSGGWNGGDVVDESFNIIAQISYNGRIWAKRNFMAAAEHLPTIEI